MTADRRRTGRWSGPVPRMRDVSHVHPDHDSRGWHWFARGPLVVADGGERADREGLEVADPDRGDRDVEDERLRDVSHQPAHGDGANRVWDRGEEEDGE